MSATNLMVLTQDGKYTSKPKTSLCPGDQLLSPEGHPVKIESITIKQCPTYGLTYARNKHIVVTDEDQLMLRVRGIPRRTFDEASSTYIIWLVKDNKIRTKSFPVKRVAAMRFLWRTLTTNPDHNALIMTVEEFKNLSNHIKSDMRMYKHNGRMFNAEMSLIELGIGNVVTLQTREPYILADTTVVW